MSGQPDRGITDIIALLTRWLAMEGVNTEDLTMVLMAKDIQTEHQIQLSFARDQRLYDLMRFNGLARNMQDGFKFMGLNIRVSRWPEN